METEIEIQRPPWDCLYFPPDYNPGLYLPDDSFIIRTTPKTSHIKTECIVSLPDLAYFEYYACSQAKVDSTYLLQKIEKEIIQLIIIKRKHVLLGWERYHVLYHPSEENPMTYDYDITKQYRFFTS
jgi:hypothetical protein